MKFLLAFCVIILALISGCTLFRPTNAYTSLESSYRGNSSSAAPSKVHDSKNLPESITLKQAIEIGLSNNPEIAAVRWDVEAAFARQKQNFGQQLPRIGLLGSYTHYVDNQRLFPAGLPGDPTLLSKNIFAGDIALSFPVFTGGRLTN